MKVTLHLILLSTAVLGSSQASIEGSLSASYAPFYVDCPKGIELVRPAKCLNPDEAEWVHKRKRVVHGALKDYLHRLDLKDFDVHEYVHRIGKSDCENVPILGMTISGGGYRSGLTGAGAIRALDSRLFSANEQRTGGLLQSLTYLAGQSGGAWPVLGLPTHDFPTIDQMMLDWHTDIDRSSDANSTYIGSSTSIFKDLAAKYEAGFPITVSDYLGRMFAYEFLPQGPHGALNITMSGIRNQSKFLSHEMPISIVQATALEASDVEYFGLKVPYSNSTNYEITPFEFGSWNPKVAAFTPIEYAGTKLIDGVAANFSQCVRGFDRASYMLGTAASAWNYWYIGDYSNQTLAQWPKRSISSKKSKSISKRDSTETFFPESTLTALIDGFAEVFNLTMPNIAYAEWFNPFFGTSSSTNESEIIQMVDSTEDGTALPLWPLIQPERNASFLIAWDDDPDAFPNNWLNGTNMYTAYLAAEAAGLPFPVVPPVNTMMNRNYNLNPIFFGCDTNLTTTKSAESPIVLYMTNSPYSAYTNYSWTQTTFSAEQLNTILTNEFNQFTQGNGTLDSEWAQCLGCAVIDRSLEKIGMQRSEQCASCLNKYCWDGILNETTPAIVNPYLRLNPTLSFAEWNLTNSA